MTDGGTEAGLEAGPEAGPDDGRDQLIIRSVMAILGGCESAIGMIPPPIITAMVGRSDLRRVIDHTIGRLHTLRRAIVASTERPWQAPREDIGDHYRGFTLVTAASGKVTVTLDGERISGPWVTLTAAQTWVDGWHQAPRK